MEGGCCRQDTRGQGAQAQLRQVSQGLEFKKFKKFKKFTFIFFIKTQTPGAHGRAGMTVHGADSSTSLTAALVGQLKVNYVTRVGWPLLVSASIELRAACSALWGPAQLACLNL